MGRTIGVDFGTARVGLAVSDPLGLTAQPLDVIDGSDVASVVSEISRLALERDASEIVVGLPLNMDGGEGPAAERVRKFAEALGEASGLDVHLEDERMTTLRAERSLDRLGESRQSRKRKKDILAAQFILQSYLDRKKREVDNKASR